MEITANLSSHLDFAAQQTITLNPECFEDLVGFPVSCQWLDSQAAVEASVPAADVRPGDVLFTSPVVYFGGRRLEG